MYKIIKNVYKIRFWRDYFETCNIWAKTKGLSVYIKILSPMGCLSLPGAIYMWKKYIKNGKKPYFKEIFFKLATNGQSDKEFLFTSTFCPQGIVCTLGLYTCIKSFKMHLKSYFKEIVLKLATNRQSDKGFLLTSTFVPKGLSAPALGLYTCIKALKGTRYQVSNYRTTGPLVWFCHEAAHLVKCYGQDILRCKKQKWITMKISRSAVMYFQDTLFDITDQIHLPTVWINCFEKSCIEVWSIVKVLIFGTDRSR